MKNRLDEMTQRIPELTTEIRKFSNDKLNHLAYENLITHNLEFICNYNSSIKVFCKKAGNSRLLFYGIDSSRKYIGYFAELEIQSCNFLKKSWCTQTMVWSSGESQFAGIVKYMVFEQYLPKFGIIMADSYQSPGGERLWCQVLGKIAFDKGFGVYIVDFNEEEIIKLADRNEFDIVLDDTELNPWGNTDKHANIRLAISLLALN